MAIETSLAWDRLCEIALGTPNWLIQIPEAGGNVKIQKNILFQCRLLGLM